MFQCEFFFQNLCFFYVKLQLFLIFVSLQSIPTLSCQYFVRCLSVFFAFIFFNFPFSFQSMTQESFQCFHCILKRTACHANCKLETVECGTFEFWWSSLALLPAPLHPLLQKHSWGIVSQKDSCLFFFFSISPWFLIVKMFKALIRILH